MAPRRRRVGDRTRSVGGAARARAPARARTAPIIAVSGASGAGKTRLLARLIPCLVGRGLRVGVVKHSGHRHGFDVPGKDTEVLRRAGAVAAAITGPGETAWFGPPVAGPRALARLLPPVDLVLAEGFKGERLPRVEVHRRSVDRRFLCAGDRRVFAVVSDEPPPRRLPTFDADDVEGLTELILARLRGRGRRRGQPRPVSWRGGTGRGGAPVICSGATAASSTRRLAGRGGRRQDGRPEG